MPDQQFSSVSSFCYPLNARGESFPFFPGCFHFNTMIQCLQSTGAGLNTLILSFTQKHFPITVAMIVSRPRMNQSDGVNKAMNAERVKLFYIVLKY